MHIATPFTRIEIPRLAVLRRGALTVDFEPLQLWLGRAPLRLSPLEAALMLLLVRRGRATWAEVDQVLRDGASSASIRDVIVYRIRGKFRAVGGADPIETVRGWGLKLRVPPDERDSTSLWIGDRRPFR
ncbi:DNA-binding response OmpR family regulator [Sphingomonas naasensis]|uniref:OmpR/PhoB-type domain-containing protein n=1 Tax=Sphingomonas naasensis TaxID=1344951 RepID=A0A4S1WGP5_9SPHN|nr:hypothetical protein [Sphingomonas naasensis]NIJ22268.1 DNA-binding response OmpR family regulator [Sphingomonas naasensis]TGX40720.1 hypothetical protein E5A74_14610 [Sphingomonas naasensis]